MTACDTNILFSRLEASHNDAFRRIYDIRLALTLRFHGVREFGTANIHHFSGFGFEKVWNPLKG